MMTCCSGCGELTFIIIIQHEQNKSFDQRHIQKRTRHVCCCEMHTVAIFLPLHALNITWSNVTKRPVPPPSQHKDWGPPGACPPLHPINNPHDHHGGLHWHGHLSESEGLHCAHLWWCPPTLAVLLVALVALSYPHRMGSKLSRDLRDQHYWRL